MVDDHVGNGVDELHSLGPAARVVIHAQNLQRRILDTIGNDERRDDEFAGAGDAAGVPELRGVASGSEYKDE